MNIFKFVFFFVSRISKIKSALIAESSSAFGKCPSQDSLRSSRRAPATKARVRPDLKCPGKLTKNLSPLDYKNTVNLKHN